MAAKPKLAPVATPPKEAAAPAEPPKSKRKLVLILAVVLVLLLAGGGGAAWYFLGHRGGDEKHEAAKAEKKAPPTFVTLDPFTVNLQEEGGADHYLQVGIVYQVADAKTVDQLKAYMPVIRSKILLQLSSKRPSEISNLAGKQKLVDELVDTARKSLPGETPERGIDGALLSSFVIQ
ncbi:MAG: flagellar basal body-associated protein FliL [Burkholderiales bacterium]